MFSYSITCRPDILFEEWLYARRSELVKDAHLPCGWQRRQPLAAVAMTQSLPPDSSASLGSLSSDSPDGFAAFSCAPDL